MRPHTTMWQEAENAVSARPCPRCGARKGEQCRDQRVTRMAREIPMPHKERREQP